MSTFIAPVEQTSDLILKGLRVELFEQIEKRLMTELQPIVRAAARAAAENVLARVQTVRSDRNNCMELRVEFNQRVLPASA